MDFSKLRLIATWLLLAGAALGLGLPAAAQMQLTPRDRVIAALENQGYQVTRVRTTWLGRVQIRARSGNLRREVVLNPNTGEVLRDYIEMVGRPGDDRSGGSDSAGRGGGGDNSGPGNSDDDDGDNSGSSHDDDDDDDDNSGSSHDDDDDDDDDDSSGSSSDDDRSGSSSDDD